MLPQNEVAQFQMCTMFRNFAATVASTSLTPMQIPTTINQSLNEDGPDMAVAETLAELGGSIRLTDEQVIIVSDNGSLDFTQNQSTRQIAGKIMLLVLSVS